MDCGPLSALAAVLSGMLVMLFFDATAGTPALTALALLNVLAAWLALMTANGTGRIAAAAGFPGLWVLAVTLLGSA